MCDLTEPEAFSSAWPLSPRPLGYPEFKSFGSGFRPVSKCVLGRTATGSFHKIFE